MKTTDNIILDITLQQAMADLDEGNYVAAFRGFESITDESLEAKYQMAMMMYNGYVEGYDASDAIQLYNECAESGLNKAFGGIACCYFFGHGVEKNDIKAYEQVQKAFMCEEPGCYEAYAFAGEILIETIDESLKDINKGIEYLNKALNVNADDEVKADAYFSLGKAYSELGLYEKAMRNTLSWSEKLKCAKECGYDYMEMCIDATDEKINRIFMNTAEKKEIMEAVFQAGLPIGSMSVSALTKYALGDPDEEIRKKAMQIAEKSIELAVDLGVRTVMIPGYDIYFGESTIETKKYFLENVKKIAEIAEREGILVGFETMENNFMNTTGKAVQYVNMVDSAYLKIYPDAGNITNAAVENQHDVCEDLSLGKGKLIALHLKETKPGIFREVPFLTGHVQFEKIINTAWSLGVRRYVTELWDVGKKNWKEDICFANQSMRTLLDREA